MASSPFSAVPMAPRDPILGLNEAFAADPRPGKVNLGVGVYYDDAGKIPLLAAVRQAEAQRTAAAPARGYLPIDGIVQYNLAVQTLLFGADSPLVTGRRVATVQALGGTGALKVGADLLRRFVPEAKVWISDPSWENHRALFEGAGFAVETYPYYDASTHGVRFDEMLATLRSLPAKSIVVLHACCHNPTGVDLTDAQWAQVVEACSAASLIPFLDIAYQGFGDGIEPDAAPVRRFAASNLDFLVSSSFSKSFSLYGERVGALSFVAQDGDEAARLLSQLKRVVRTNYSNPPTHGGSVVATVLNTPELRALWEQELAGMRDRIRAMRDGLVERLAARGVARDFGFVRKQRGMFSYSGLTAAQVERLREEYGIYAVSTGRVCLAALNSRNIDGVADAIAKVIA
ncbi:MAG TPA: amino acid aminotransferase [Burkholderiaceae bacterium]|nr:amino acid aminotransferase [Burkholderiaceae bacterium]